MYDLEQVTGTPPKDILVKIQLQNNRIWNLVKSKWGDITQAELARRTGINAHDIGKILCFKKNVVTKTSSHKGIKYSPVIGYSGLYWAGTVSRLAKALDVLPEYLFPEEFRSPKQNTYEFEVSTAEALAYTTVHTLPKTPEELLLGAENKKFLTSALEGLGDRYQYVLRNRFGIDGLEDAPLSLDQIAEKMDVTRERIRQLEHTGLEKLKFAFDREQAGPVKTDERMCITPPKERTVT